MFCACIKLLSPILSFDLVDEPWPLTLLPEKWSKLI
ncbi:MAG: hypothetical protein RL013_814 [Bacteroidota bacterium]|jgi:hypothetical protein